MKSWRSALLFLLFAAPLNAAPLFGPAEHLLWSRVPILPDVVRGASARGSASGGFTGGSVTGITNFTARVTFGSAADAANAVDFNVTAGCLTFEGATANASELNLCAPDAGSDFTITLPNAASTLPIFGQQITFAGPTAARTITLVDADQTLVNLASNQTFSGTNIFTGTVTANSDVLITLGTGSLGRFQWDTTNTPDTLKVSSGAAGNSVLLVEVADQNLDSNNGPCLTAACSHPTLVVMSQAAGTTADYSSHSYAGIAGKSVKTLAEGAATSVVQITVAAEAGTAGEALISVYATDGSTPQMRSLRIVFAVANDGGTETCAVGTAEELDVTPTGTLTATVTCDTTPTNAVDLQVNATSSLTQTTLEAYTQVILAGPGQLLPQ